MRGRAEPENAPRMVTPGEGGRAPAPSRPPPAPSEACPWPGGLHRKTCANKRGGEHKQDTRGKNKALLQHGVLEEKGFGDRI